MSSWSALRSAWLSVATRRRYWLPLIRWSITRVAWSRARRLHWSWRTCRSGVTRRARNRRIPIAHLMAAGRTMVTGGAWLAPTVEFPVTRGIPVCGRIGLQPQSVYRFGGYKAQGKTDESAGGGFQKTPGNSAGGLGLQVV